MKMNTVKYFAFAAALLAGAAARASGTNGDIYEIRPCTQEGVARDAWATKAEPLDSGVTAYFNMRLIQGASQDNERAAGGENSVWYLDYDGLGSETLYEYYFPLQVGIYVSGRLTYATLISWKADKASGFTDLIFEYTTEPGDFALPVVLATETGPATTSTGSNKYIFNRYGTGQWKIVNNNGEEFNKWIWSPKWPVSAPEGERSPDYALLEAGIYVKTIDFDSKWESGSAETYADDGTGLWRSVHEGSIETVGATPTLQAIAAPTNAVTLYVWSEDESAVKISGGKKMRLTTGYDGGEPVIKETYVGTVRIAGGQTSQNFYIEGVSQTGGADGDGKTTLVLSPWANYSYNSVSERIDDYVTVPVKCVEPLPPTVVVESESGAETVYVPVGNGWKTKVETLNVYVTQPVEEDLAVTVTPSVLGKTLDMSKYVLFSTDASSVKTISQLSPTATVTIPAGQSGKSYAKKVNVYLFRADSETDGETVDFTPSLEPMQTVTTGIQNFIPEAFEIVASAPEFVSPEDGAPFGATAGVETEIELEVADTYADEHYTPADGDGYKIEVKYTATSGWKTLAGTYYVTAGNVLRTADGKLPVLKFPNSSIGQTDGTFQTQIRITEPINENPAILKLVSTVAAPKTVTVASSLDEYNEGAVAEFTVTLNSPNDTGDALYAFLLAGPGDEATKGKFNAQGRKFVLTDDILSDPAALLLTSGLVINPDNDSATGKVKLLDGADLDATGGSTYFFSVVLCTTAAYSEDSIVSGYNSNFKTISVYNVQPTITRLEMNGYASPNSGYVYPNRLPKGNEQKFKAVVKDPGSYDLEDGFQTRWTCYRNGNAVYTTVIDGNPGDDANFFTYAFPNAGEWTVKAEVQDKDMDDWSEISYSVGVTVLDNPVVGVTVSEAVDENATKEKATIQLSYWDDQFDGELLVKVTVSEYSPGRANPGKLKLDRNYASTVAGEDNVYYITVNSANEYDLMLEEMDGTDVSSIYGFSITAEVVSDTELPTSKTPASAYYLPESRRVLVNNVSPTVIVNPEPNTNRWEVAGGVATSYPIRWKIQRDVDSDFTDLWSDNVNKGIHVEITGCDNGESKYYEEPTSGIFYPDFGELQGDVTVTLTIEDKDGGYYSYSYLYTVSASKFLVTKASGPNGGTSTSALSKKYSALPSRGLGHVYAAQENGVKFSSAANFLLRWNCGKNTDARIYAFGYKVDKPDDDGTLDGGLDVAINPNGAVAAGEVLTDFYHYPLADLDEDSADRKDSFFYAWIQHLASEDGALTSSIMGATILPESPTSGTADGKVMLPTEQTEDGNYVTTEVEAIFAKEWLKTDNLGDINGDGVPDVYAMQDWQDGNLIETVSGGDRIENDLFALNSSNPDGDALPGVLYDMGKGLKVDGSNMSYAPIGFDFTTRMELRGLHDGLNAVDMTTSDPDFGELEEAAWSAYAEANGLDPETDKDLSKWSPEPKGTYPRLDPTVDDTDGDKFPDGWEYFFWYQAHVWVPSGDAKGQPIKTDHTSQKYVFERFRFSNILEGEEITAEEVEERFNPLTALSAAEYADKPDFDNDGISDLEELVIGTNPCHWDTDGDHICDAWEVMMGLDPLTNGKTTNPDGDWMAYHRTKDDVAYMTDPETGRVYVLSDLEEFVDYNPYTMTTVRTGEFKYFSFIPKADDEGNPILYGREEDAHEPSQPTDWIYGLPMVDSVQRGTVVFDAPVQLNPAGDFVLIHNQVMDAYGFDPRTGWSAASDGYVSPRWNPSVNKNISSENKTGYAVNTRGYYSYDEYLVMKYRYEYDIHYDTSKPEAGFDEKDVWATIRNKTTIPTVLTVQAAEPEQTQTADTNETASASASVTNAEYEVSMAIAAALNKANSAKKVASGHGADTDGDGVPDGWELYTFRNPNNAPRLVDEDGLGDSGLLDFDDDSLSYAREYAGTDACDVYTNCPTIYANHPGNVSGWWNKFFPTNPGTMMDRGTSYMGYGNPDGADTDLDGVPDGYEGGTWAGCFYEDGRYAGSGKMGFIYGMPNPTNMANKTCIQGGGMNPCTIDTDQDGLPDAWEAQFSGIPVDRATGLPVPVRGSEKAVVSKLTHGTKTADADYSLEGEADDEDGQGDDSEEDEKEESDGSSCYIAGGMDATYSGDASSLSMKRDVDFDHDGLENWQEYMVQATRHFRYDDITTPLMGRQIEEGDIGYNHQQNFWGFVPFDAADPETFAADCAEAWYGKDAVYYVTVTTGVRKTYELVNPQTGEMKTNLVFSTERRKKYVTSAEEVVRHVNSSGTYQYAWNDEGWRKLGYFAKPRQYWDAAIVSGNIAKPLYMFSVIGEMQFENASPVGYVSTDPRCSDTDADGLDDYWEIFHGLNPILGSDVERPGYSMLHGTRCGDIIGATYGLLTASLFNGFWNEWIHPDYMRRYALHNMAPDETGPIDAPQAFDPVLYPWIMGSPGADADGDGMRNEDERILGNVTDPLPRHTDPSPQWFTERTTPSSYTAQYYKMPANISYMTWARVYLIDRPDTPNEEATVLLSGGGTYVFPFEENEGYDTDRDVSPDSREVTSTTVSATDPNKFTDPVRHQALYLDGVNSFAMSREMLYRPVGSIDLFKQFTVECWLRPDAVDRQQTVIERSSYYGGDSIVNDKGAVRANFRIGITADGLLYGSFDNTDSIESGLNSPISCQNVYDPNPLEEGEWVHAALSFDGSVLTLYKNGKFCASAKTGLSPANGIWRILQDPASTNSYPSYKYASHPVALFIGARPQAQNKFALNAYTVEGDKHYESFENLREYFKGYVDEVRIWDGARAAADIALDYRKEYSFDDVAAQRKAVFDSWLEKATRNNNDANGNLPPELVHHYNFATLAGSTAPEYVSKTPPGFESKVLAAAMSDYSNPEISTDGLYPNLLELKGGDYGEVEGDLKIGWWNDCLIHSTVYDDYHVVPWIQNTVAHLPALDGTCPDSTIYAVNYGGKYTSASMQDLDKYLFPNTANPYTTMFTGWMPFLRYKTARRIAGVLGDRYQLELSRYGLRSNFATTSDLLPMGGAYAKSCEKMWYGAASGAWEYTGTDDDADGLPDWWEEYARNNYCEHLDPAAPLNWDTVVYRNGIAMAAATAYMLDLYNGLQPDFEFDDAFVSTYDANGNYIPDWWEGMYRIEGTTGTQDSDGDGLSDYAEYLLSEVFDVGAKFDPLDPVSVNGKDLDYFAKIGEIYAGEIFTDHDMMEDLVEDKQDVSYMSRYLWDADSDYDEDGWTNFQETRHAAFTSRIRLPQVMHYVANEETKDMPIPALKLVLRYNGDQKINQGSGEESTETEGAGEEDDNQIDNKLSNIIVETYTKDGLVVPDARFALTPGETLGRRFYIGGWSDRIVRGVLAVGYVQAADLKLMALPVSAGAVYTWRCGHGDCRGSFSDYLRHVYNEGSENVELLTSDPVWSEVVGISVVLDVDTSICKILYNDEQIGVLDSMSGEFELDLGGLSHVRTVENPNIELDLDTTVFRFNYKSQIPVLGKDKYRLYLGEPNTGFVKGGKNTIVAYYDLDGNGAYTSGEPLGCLSNVDIDWYGGEYEIELTDTSPIITRANLLTGESTDASDRRYLYGTEDGDATNFVAGVLNSEKYQRIRIVRTHVNGNPVQDIDIVYRVVLDKMMELSQRPYFYEGDILESGDLDLDWSYFQSEVMSQYSDPTEVTYRIILGNGSIDPTATNNVYSIATVRHFDSNSTRAVPRALTPGEAGSVQIGDNPVFTWTMDGMNSYTAFRLQILKAGGSTVVWDSGVRRAPAMNLEGVYSFKADAYVGDELEKGVAYTWRVTMLNAKFQSVRWSTEMPTFYMGTPEAAINYQSVPVAVRYFGPASVANAAQFVVEAFKSPDFSGLPVSRTYVRLPATVTATGTVHEANAKLIGLPAGKYYIRAYADLNAYGTRRARDSWESWGYACPRNLSFAQPFTPSAIVVPNANVAIDTVEVYIEDVDTNQNTVPDAYEIVANNGKLDNGAARPVSMLAGNVTVNDQIAGRISGKVVSAAGVTPSYDPYLNLAFSSGTMTALALGVDPAKLTFNGDGSVTVDNEVEDVAISSVGFDADGRLIVSVEGTLTGDSVDGFGIVTVNAQSRKTVVCNVYRKETLDQDGWDLIATKEITVGSEAQDVEIEGVEKTASGFFKVTVTK